MGRVYPLHDYEYDAEKSAKSVEAGIYRHEAHNWCFKHSWGSYDMKPALPRLRCPTLVTVGRWDWLTPVSSAEAIASLIPSAKLMIFEKSGHSPQIEEFEHLQQVMREFLDEVFPADAPVQHR